MITRRAVVIAGAAAAAISVAACGGGSSGGAPPATTIPTPVVTHTVTITETPSPTTTPSSSTTNPLAPQAAGCTTGQLKVTLGAGQGTAGSTYQPIVFTNTSSAPCTLTGYPGVSFVDASGTQLGKPSARSHASFSAVTLTSGGKASALLQLPDPGVFSPSACNETTASRLKIYPPNQTGALLVTDHAEICTTKAGRTRIGPVHTGTSG